MGPPPPKPAAASRPPAAGRFSLEIDGGRASFAEVVGLPVESNAVDYRTGAEDKGGRKVTGVRKNVSITLVRGYTDASAFINWIRSAEQGRLITHDVHGFYEHRELVRYEFRQCLISDLSVPPLDKSGRGLAIDRLTLRCAELK
jgi:phage tail-like protein